MISKKLNEIYNVDTISMDRGWEKIYNNVKDIDYDLEIDFTGVNIVEPWNSANFIKLCHLKHIYMVFKNSESLVEHIKMLCILEGIPDEHVRNIKVEEKKVMTPEELKVIEMGDQVADCFDIYEDKAVFVAAKRYSQMHGANTSEYIRYAIEKINKEKGINNFIVEINGISVIDIVLDRLASTITELEGRGITLKVDIDDPESCKTLALYLHNNMAETYDEKRRFMEVRKMKPNTVGLLVKYKASKSIDAFGRQGKGKVVSNSISIFNGFVKSDDGVPMMKVTVFKDVDFYPRKHYASECDGNVPSRLACEEVIIPMLEIGIGNKFLGSRYHFISPVQRTKAENRTIIIDFDEEGYNIKKVCTLPERIKVVLDDWGIPYNQEELEKAIVDTENSLRNEESDK